MIAIRIALIVLLAVGSGLAQAPMRFTSGTAAVRVDVLVTAGNRPVMGLKASDFELRDNGVLQQIRDVSQETLPLNLFCVLDVSGSVDGQPLIRLKEATSALFGTLRDRDRAALLTFADRLVLHSPLTGDVPRLALAARQHVGQRMDVVPRCDLCRPRAARVGRGTEPDAALQRWRRHRELAACAASDRGAASH
jgi:hypothetical protein